MSRKTLGTEAILFWALSAGFLPACQDYPFENVPSTIIKEKRWSTEISITQNIDILFVVDNSGSMVGEQVQLGKSFKSLVGILNDKFGADKFRIGVITPGMKSDQCPACGGTIISSCINATGENGTFQDLRGKIVSGDVENPGFDWVPDPNCKVVDSSKLDCFYCDPAAAPPCGGDPNRGIVMVGTTGCGYERGLAAIKSSLSGDMLKRNGDFLRDSATLAVVVVSDEEDCGQVGDVSEIPGKPGGDICYFASKGVGPDNETVFPSDPRGKKYALTPVEDYYNFLIAKKGQGNVKFAAIVGVKNKDDPSSTTIEYGPDKKPLAACTTPSCVGSYCSAFPGTRYIQLAQMFGVGGNGNGFIDTICQGDFSNTMVKLGNFVSCPRLFKLTEPIVDSGLANIIVNGTPVPRYSCDLKDQPVTKCKKGSTCSGGTPCVPTWSYIPPDVANDPAAPGGIIQFAAHYDPCSLVSQGDISIELVYVTE